MDFDNKLFNIGLQYPDKIDHIIKILEDENKKSVLHTVKEIWIKSGKVPTIDSINQSANLDITREEVNEGDLIWLVELYNNIARHEIVVDLMDSAGAFSIEDMYDLWNKKIIDLDPPNIITSSSFNDIINDIKQMKNRIEEKVDTGFVQLNDLLNKGGKEGWSKRYAYLFQGLTGTGKSFFLANMAVRALKKGLKVAFISIEMDQWQVRDLIYRSYFNVSNIDSLVTLSHAEVKDFELTVMNYSNMSHTMFDIQKDITKLKNKPDIVIVDYLDNIAPSRTTQQSWQVHEVVSQDIIRVAQELDLPIITATQTNRLAAGQNGGTKRNVGYESTGSSFNKTYGFAGIWSIITDDDDYNEDEGCRKFELHCIKNREGKQTKTYYVLNYHNAHLYEESELTGIIETENMDKYIKQANRTIKGLEADIKNESIEEADETIKNFNKYYEKLKDEPNYKTEVQNIDKYIFNHKQKQNLLKKIREHQKHDNDTMSIEDMKKVFGRK